MGALVQEGIDLLAQSWPISGPTVPVEHVAAQPVPERLDRGEPGGRGGQPDGLHPRHLLHRGQDSGLVVDRPGILHDVDAPHTPSA